MFVGGPIQHALNGPSGRFEVGVRFAIEALIEAIESAGFKVMSAHEVEQYGEDDMSHLPEVVATRDFQWMREATAYVCLMPSNQHGTIRSDGSCVELGWATALQIPVLVLRDATTDMSIMSALVRGLPAVSPVSFGTYSSIPDLTRCVREFCGALDVMEPDEGTPTA